MEPLESDYTPLPSRRRRAADPTRRYNWLYLFPVVGILVVLLFASAGLFQFSLAPIVDGLMGFLILLFALFVVAIFWASAPRRGEQS
ncbi:hypothetical protein [Thermogemmatispora sp.]|uniref:hypothetical protein n=1 Tax=Thermogemmatispora sp. TaxID=1968838 RepID=UPI001DB18743|nr:hypothetical protein [Thermogemmatispora sp.]MBX5448678.1 hypothetical protein [Thermogemmatispora sp.]